MKRRKFLTATLKSTALISISAQHLFACNDDEAGPSSSLPAPRNLHAATFNTSNNELLIFGGSTASGEDNLLWSFRNNTWTQLSSAGPDKREDSLLIYHKQNNRSYLIGGRSFSSNQNYADFWEWNGSTWNQLSDSNPFGYLAHTCAAYDEKNNRIVLFGGLKQGAPSNELWMWSDNEWKQIPVEGEWPSARLAASLVYSSAHKKIFLFGGSQTNGTIITDVWQLDGGTWSKKNEAFPRIGNGAYHVAAMEDQFVMFGGFTESRQRSSKQFVYDVELNEWSDVSITEPTARALHSLVNDPTNNRLLMFGGGSAESLLNELWAYKNNTWTQL